MKIEIVANPASGSYNKEMLDECAAILTKRHGETVITHTECPNDATRIAKESSADLVIAAGGDGLVNEAAAGMLDKKNTLFSVLPFGTVNVFCREYKIPLNPVKASHILNPDKIKTLPLGLLNERPFILMCGVGYDASVVRRVTEKQYKKNKTLAHIKEGIGALRGSYPALQMYVNGKEFTAYHAIVSLGRCYAGNFRLSKDIKDNTLNIFMRHENSTAKLALSIASMAAGFGFGSGAMYSDNMKIVGTEDFQLDGEYINTGSTQNYITIRKSALAVALN